MCHNRLSSNFNVFNNLTNRNRNNREKNTKENNTTNSNIKVLISTKYKKAMII